MLLFIAIGTLLPTIASDLGTSYAANSSMSNITGAMGSDFSDTSAWTIFKSVTSMFFWTFGAIWWPLDLLLLLPLRIVLVLILVRWVRGVAS